MKVQNICMFLCESLSIERGPLALFIFTKLELAHSYWAEMSLTIIKVKVNKLQINLHTKDRVASKKEYNNIHILELLSYTLF